MVCKLQLSYQEILTMEKFKSIILLLLVVLAVDKGYAKDPVETHQIISDQIFNDQGSIIVKYPEEINSQVSALNVSPILQFGSSKSIDPFIFLKFYFIQTRNVINTLTTINTNLSDLFTLNFQEAFMINPSGGLRSYKLHSRKSNETKKIVIFQ